MKNKYLVITERFYPEEFLVNELVREWKLKRMPVTVLTQVPTYPYGKIFNGYKNGLFSTSYWENIEIKRIYSITGYRNNRLLKILSIVHYLFWASVFIILNGWRYNRIFVYQVGALTVAIPAIIAKKIYRKKIIIWSQDIWPDTIYPDGFVGLRKKIVLFLSTQIVSFVYRNIDEIVVSCEPFINKIRKYVGNKNIHYLPNWPFTDCEEDDGIVTLSNKVNYTFAGNINKWRSLEIIIESFHEFNSTNNNAQLNIIGDGSGLEKLKTMVAENNIKDVVFWGRIPAIKMKNYYKGSDILIISLAPNSCYSLYLPAKFSTYLTIGKPIMAVMNGVVSEIIHKHGIGVAVSPLEKKEIIKAFYDLSNITMEKKVEIENKTKILLEKEFDKIQIIDSLTNIFTN